MFGVVFTSEYLRRVRTKAFILSTLLLPLGIAAAAAVAGTVVSSAAKSEKARKHSIAVLDESRRILPELMAVDNPTYRLHDWQHGQDAGKEAVINGDYDAFLVLPRALAEAGGTREARLYSKRKQSLTAQQAIRSFVLNVVREVRIAQYELTPQVRNALSERLSLVAVSLTEEGEEGSGSVAASLGVGMGLGGIFLAVMTIYGSLVMQSVMEDKTSRMAEILVSSVRPFELAMGKVLAVGAMALTQLATWFLMLLAIGVVAVLVLANVDTGEYATMADELPAKLALSIRFDVVAVVLVMLPIGFLVNAAVFGALGSMYETPQEAQISVSIAMLPLLLSIIMVQTAVVAPNNAFIVFGSFFPLTSPVVLPLRMLVADVAAWQVFASLLLTVAGGMGMVWLSGRVFRGSLLIYGKKPTFKELWRIITAD